MALYTQEITYHVGGKTFKGYFAVDQNNSGLKPGILIAPEWWGRNEYAKGRAEQLAKQGFAAMAIDLYGDGKVAETPEEAGELKGAARNEEGAIEARFMAAYAALSERADVDDNQMSALGYCFGGAVVLAMARAGKELKVVASFHGVLQTETPLSKDAFAGKILVFNGADDPMVTPEIVSDFKAEMDAADADYELIDYPGVLHGFTNPAATAKGKATGMPLAYDEFADTDSFARTLSALNS